MAKIRNDYENSFGQRFSRWLKNGTDRLEKYQVMGFGEMAEQNEGEEDAAVRRETESYERDKRQQENERAVLSRFHSWSVTKGKKWINRLYFLVSVALCAGIIAVLLQVVAALPPFGSATNPVNNEVAARYIENGMEETGAVNIVAGMILDYRAFDTLGESHVLFIAVCAVMMLLMVDKEKGQENVKLLDAEANDRMYEPKNDSILQVVTRALLPFILMFGVYVMFNGHLSAGGGFSGGAVMGAGLILYLCAFGFAKTERFFTKKTFSVISCCALGFYSLSKMYSFFTGANGLESIISAGTPGKLFSAGLILPLNIAVGFVVALTMYTFYALFRKGDF